MTASLMLALAVSFVALTVLDVELFSIAGISILSGVVILIVGIRLFDMLIGDE